VNTVLILTAAGAIVIIAILIVYLSIKRDLSIQDFEAHAPLGFRLQFKRLSTIGGRPRKRGTNRKVP
jgi:hypothetical protein